jgi:hypothetical protein
LRTIRIKRETMVLPLDCFTAMPRKTLSTAAAGILLVLLSPAGAMGQIDPELHQRCLNARDYSGCIEAQRNAAAGSAEAAPLINACPAGHAYSGAGYCTRVICQSPKGGLLTRMILSSDGHDPDLAGKGNKCPRTGLISRTGSLRWGTDTVKAVHDDKCPNVELTVGWQNTCLQAAPQQVPAASSNN